MGPAEALNLGEPSIPRPAASVILLRRGGRHANRGLEVLLARRSDNSTFMPGVWVFPGGSVDPEDGPTHPEGAAQRACAARELKEEVGIALPPEAELVPYARWITPTVVKTRFDAWFFLALAPPHSPPRPDGVETDDAGWFAPAEALTAQQAGDLPLVFPTIHQLRGLTEFESAAEALAAWRRRRVAPVTPVAVQTADGPRIAMPGDPDYPD